MLKMKKLTLAIAMATALAGCANIGDSIKRASRITKIMRKSPNNLM